MVSVSKGTGFENRIADLYKMLGYSVKKNVKVLGSQIDLILNYPLPDGAQIKTAVECKFVNKGNLHKNSVMQNLNALIYIKSKDKVQNLVLVTTNGFAKDIWDIAKSENITLLTIGELENKLVQLDDYLNFLITNFEQDEIKKYYVDLLVFSEESIYVHKKTKEKVRAKQFLGPLNSYINNWLNNDKMNMILMLGEFGSGKTSFCRKIAYELAKQYKDNPLKNRIPLLIKLRDFSDTRNTNRFSIDTLIGGYRFTGSDFSTIWKMNEKGRFVIILDGFDEMNSNVLFDDTLANFSGITEFAIPQYSKVLVTCRTEFFRTHNQERETLDDFIEKGKAKIMYLNEFSESQIKSFLKNRVPLVEKQKKNKLGWEYFYLKIHSIFDLKDLAKRPVLLELITKYLPKLINKGIDINASSLYSITIKEELKRRLKVGRIIIQRSDRIKLMKLLSVWMHNNSHYSLHYSSIAKHFDLKNHFELKTKIDIEYYLHNFLTCSFLSRDKVGNYQFSHKSYVDFFVAWQYVEDLENNFYTNLSEQRITPEIIQFMKAFGLEKEKLLGCINFSRNKSFEEIKYLGGNAISIMNGQGVNFSKTEFDFTNTELSYANFESLDLSGVDFANSKLNSANFNDTILTNANLSNSELKNASFDELSNIGEVKYSPKGKFLAAEYSDYKYVKIFATSTYKNLSYLRGHTSNIHCMVFSPDERLFITASDDKTFKVWDTIQWKEILTVEAHSGSIYSVVFSPDGKHLVSSSYDKTIKVWDTKSWKNIYTILGHDDWISGISFSPDGKYLASASYDKTAKVWLTESWKEIITIDGFEEPLHYVLFSPDNSHLAMGGVYNPISLFKIGQWECKELLTEGLTSAFALSFSPDGKYLAIGDESEFVKIWDTKTCKIILELEEIQGGVTGVSFNTKGSFLATTCYLNMITIWNLNHQSDNFGKMHKVIENKIKCEYLNIKDSTGLDDEMREYLVEQGATI